MVNYFFRSFNCFIFLSSDQMSGSLISKLNKKVCKCLSFQPFLFFQEAVEGCQATDL